MTSNYVGSMFGVFFTEDAKVTRYEQVANGDIDRFKKFFHAMLEQGVYLAPSAFEAGFVSSAHNEETLEKTLKAAHKAFAKL